MAVNGRNTTAGVVVWTPAPSHISPTSSVASEWEDEEEEEDDAKRKVRPEEEEEFHSYMDENGIIGLEQALEGVCLGEEDEGDEGPGTEGDPPWYAGALDPNEDSLGREGEASLGPELREVLEELQDSEPLSLTELSVEDTHTHSFYGQESVDVWTEEEEMEKEEREEERQKWAMLRQSMERLPERDRQLDMTEDEKDRESEGSLGEPEHRWTEEGSGREEGGKNPHPRLRSGDDLLPESGERWDEGYRNGTASQVGRASGSLSPSARRLSPTPLSPSPREASVFPHLRHFSSEELADAPGIQAEMFPDSLFTESLQEARSSGPGRSSKPFRNPESEGEGLRSRPTPASGVKVSVRPNGAGDGPAEGMDAVRPGTPPSPGPRKTRPRSLQTGSPSLPPSPESVPEDRGPRTPRESPLQPQPRSQGTEMDEGRRGPLTYRTPDFSRVEPRVRFPKSGYTPPKSRGSPKKRPSSAEPPLVYKSPADIVTEVLLSGTDGPSSPAQSGANNSTVPEEFRCPRQATTLVHQLQEDYNRLLTKYAEAENTIDRMRLKAKVNLYSDPPKPSHAVQSGVLHEGLKIMTLSFPQAQRAELHSGDSHLAGQGTHPVSPACPSSAASSSSRSSPSHVGQQLTRVLSQQAERFLQQVLAFHELLTSGRLKPFEQMKGLSQLAQGLDSLERGYLSARDQHRLLLQRGLETRPFDPDRELEGRIFQCGMRMEDLKEQVEQTEQHRPTSEAPPSPPPQPTPLSMPTGEREALPYPESPVVPVPGQPGGVVGAEVSSASEEEEALPSLFLQPLTPKHRLVERDFSTLMDQYQSFRELPKVLGGGEGSSVSVSPGAEHRQPGEGTLQESGSVSNQRRQRLRVPNAVPGTSTSGPPSPPTPSQSRALPGGRANGSRGSEGRKSRWSSLTSLGDGAWSERRGSKRLHPGSKPVMSQDGVVSPETDSGFVGSEGSRLNVAAPSPHHRRAPVSVSTTPDLRPALLSGQLPATQRPPFTEDSAGSHLSSRSQPRESSSRARRGEGRVASASSSPQHWASRPPKHWRDSGTSGFGPDSDQAQTVSGEEEGQSDLNTPASNSHPSYRPSPSPTSPDHHGDALRAQRAGQLTHRHEAIQCLQAEVGRLKERLEGSLRQANPKPVPVRAPPSAREAYFTIPHTSTPLIGSTHRRRNGSKGRSRKERNGRVALEEEEEKDSPRPTPRGRSSSVPRRGPELDITCLRGCLVEEMNQIPEGGRRQPQFAHSVTLTIRDILHDQRGAPLNPSTAVLSLRLVVGVDRQTQAVIRPPPESAFPERRRNRSSGHAPRGPQPTSSPHWDGRGVYLAAPSPPLLGAVPLVQCVPVCGAPPLLYYPSTTIKTDSYLQSFYVSPYGGGGGGLSLGVRGRAEVKGCAGRSHSADQYSLNKSLNRAIQAAKDMKAASRRMARSMATGLHHQEALSHSCIY
ncbi:microtubule organization protein AKNA [Aplochiton taeniatus]